ncbi:MAG TPA: hypothetical protein VL422_03710 [Miltoncostaea sp.]|nr:hypothetical protein [Miltoncostaea sp.]
MATGRKPGVGVAVVVGLPGAAARAATKGRRDTALHIVHRDDDGREHDCRYAVDRSRAVTWTEELARAGAPPLTEPGNVRHPRGIPRRRPHRRAASSREASRS